MSFEEQEEIDHGNKEILLEEFKKEEPIIFCNIIVIIKDFIEKIKDLEERIKKIEEIL